ncbi:achaete-scute [Elysia marginata]|uniref:Achaete-scute n=1 Tax=Elysia marginata TaxID=1093978 RepID=A0AAV4IMA1_9GAST|nr:achaete-scute [Elysia marginata]
MLTDRQCRSSPGCTVALPEGVLLEPGFIHRRNERERDRVRSLNQGYDVLKQSLPLTNKDKRISKVPCRLAWAIRDLQPTLQLIFLIISDRFSIFIQSARLSNIFSLGLPLPLFPSNFPVVTKCSLVGFFL